MDVEPGGQIHAEHPYSTPAGARDPLRRFRGRLVASVTLWTAGTGRARAGLTVASTLVVDGDPARLVGMIDPESDLAEAIDESGCFVVQLLTDRHRVLADRFAGLAPAPGGVFAQQEWTDTEWGPVLAAGTSWLGCRYDGDAAMGWSRRIDATVRHVSLGDDEPTLLYRRGRYHTL